MAPQPRYLCCAVTPEQEGCTVRQLLKSQFHMAEGYVSSLKWRENGILLDGERVRTTQRVKSGSTLSVRIDDGVGRNEAEPVPIPLHFHYEDADLAVIEKPAGLLVHGAPEKGAPTLANALASCWGPEQPFHPIHRLDRGTSGLLLVAKNAYVSDRLRRALHTEGLIREYLALVRGEPTPPSGRIDRPIGPAEGETLRRCVREDGQRALTEYALLRRFPGGSLLRLRLYTGRTHQIRVHLKSIGCPLFGDAFYGGAGEGLDRPALHAAFLRLSHPITGECLAFASPLPEDLQRFLDERSCEQGGFKS